MKKVVAVVALTLPMLSSAAWSQERAGDAALGAVSGAVVLGPIGALAGAVVGYTAGPSIAHSWGVRRSSKTHRRSARRSKQAATAGNSRRAPGPRAASSTAVPAAASPAPAAAEVRTTMPPVQALE
jgi:hypothetical protein